jgi:hypothetical protein
MVIEEDTEGGGKSGLTRRLNLRKLAKWKLGRYDLGRCRGRPRLVLGVPGTGTSE